MRNSLGTVVIAAVLLGMQISAVAAQASEELPPPPPPTSEPYAAPPSAEPSTAPRGTETTTATPSTAPPSLFESDAAPPSTIDPVRTAKNVLYVELLGNGILYSLNYERFLTDDVALRVGLGYLSLTATSGSASARANVLWLPLMVNYMGIGSADHKFELGIGPGLLFASAAASSVGDSASNSGVAIYGTATVGYRYVPHDGGFNFKIGFTPLVARFGFLPWFGLGFGAVF